MNGDSAPISVLFVANLWKKLTGWAVCVRDAHRTLDRLHTPASGSGRPGTPCHAGAVGASSMASGLILRHVDGR